MSPSTNLSHDFNDPWSNQPSSKLPNLTGRFIGAGAFKLLKKIGQGSFGIVYLGEDMRTEPRKLVAIKNPVEGRNVSIEREIKLQSRAAAATSGVIPIFEVIRDEDWELTFIVTEYCPDGDLFEKGFDKTRGLFDEKKLRDVILQILDAVDACHEQGIYHRDLKPENVLCTDGGARVLLTDFGFATSDELTTHFGMGTEYYMSPEVHGGLHVKLRSYCSARADIWALGVIIVNLVTGEYPWMTAHRNDDNFEKFIYNEPDFLLTLGISDELNVILKGIFTANPRNRVTLKQLRSQIVVLKYFREQPPPLVRSVKKRREAKEVPTYEGKGKARAVDVPEDCDANSGRSLLDELLDANLTHDCRSGSFGSVHLKTAFSDDDDFDDYSSSSEGSYDSEDSCDSDNGIWVGPQMWPAGLGPDANAIASNIANNLGANAALMSAFLGGADADDIELVGVAGPSHHAPLVVMNPSPPSCDSASSYSSSSSTSESEEEAITPETHAVDEVASATADKTKPVISKFDLSQPVSSSQNGDAPAPITLFSPLGDDVISPSSQATRIDPLILPMTKKQHLRPYLCTEHSSSEPFSTGNTHSAAQNMLLVAARRMRVKKNRVFADVEEALA